MHTDQVHKFIEAYDDDALLINDRANHLYKKLLMLDISDTGIDEFGKYYFNTHHTGNRLFFSVQSSADIIYRSVKKTNKAIPDIVFIDYGAGLGTLFLLAGSVGFKKTCFNDYFPQWAGYAMIICDKLGIRIDDFISGDIDTVIEYAKAKNIHFDIIASRNVVEHIYRLRDFYSKLYRSGIATVCYATTTANYQNPAMRLKHYWHHYQVEKKFYISQRKDIIKELKPGISTKDLQQLINLNRGRAFTDFTNTIDLYFTRQPIAPVEFLGTNTCDCKTGVWAENLITKQNYYSIIRDSGFAAEYTAGLWDTHYKYKFVNLITGILNRVIKLFGKKGYWFAPFVNVTACKK